MKPINLGRRLSVVVLALIGCGLLIGMNFFQESLRSSQSTALVPQNWGDWQGYWYFLGESSHWPALGQNQDGRLELFTAVYSDSLTYDSTVYHKWQTSPNGDWSFFDSLGQNTAYVAPVVGQNPDGRMEVFAQDLWYGFGSPPCSGPHYEVSHIWQMAPSDGWSDWATLGQPSCSIDLDTPFVGTNQDGRMDVFAKGSDHAVWHKWQTAPGDGWASSWASLGLPSGLSDVSPVMSIGRMQDGRLVVFVLGDNYEIYQDWQTTAGDENNWSGWVGFGRPDGVYLSEPVVSQNQDGRLEFFAAGSDGNMWHKWQVAPNTYWSGWGSLGKPFGINLSTPVVGTHPDGTMDVFSTGDDDALWHTRQIAPSDGWGNWESLGKPALVNLTDQLTVGRNQDGTLVIFAVSTDGGLFWRAEQISKIHLPLIFR